ncbi:hypothetical protein DSCO28_35390 [Desulfosarcina ovata subsp. sediminis]|uniref:Uncharacterized protein n=1 Tax=Desulfosarcina ovata subsp. sediminis TaxID=885957 RepID=A0A5K7ZRZ4_9BACT|nr:hypothetical protein [Desulfosarcina ovata]BBO82973.1 hypothetical protein DSCO28_35390 [Desulfosarcina ovata subsp. sediminis]
MTDIELTIPRSTVSLFLPLMQKGVVIAARTGCSIRQFICGQLGISDAYLDQRVQTLFLNARPVDDVDAAVLEDGATLALSAAMPGLLGATMRKGGHYAAFRMGISLSANTPPANAPGTGRVTLKLFNMVAREVGPGLLEKGVGVDGSDLNRIAGNHPEAMPQVQCTRVDGKRPADPAASVFLSLEGRPVHLTVRIAEPAPMSNETG